jgi:hypothetical protein
MQRKWAIVSLVLLATGAVTLAARTSPERQVRINPGSSVSPAGPVLVTVDCAKAVNIMRGGIGASWHAIETPIPYGVKHPVFTGYSHGGSGWGGYPPADDERAWQQIYRYADWLGLDWNRVEIEQRIYEPERGVFTLDSPEMRILYRILDWHQSRQAEVFFQQMWCNAAWLAYPEFRDDLVGRVHSAPADLEAFADGLATLMEHLVKKRGYTCIKWLCINNEPGANFSWWQAPPNKPLSIGPGLAAVRKALDQRGLKLPLSGPDMTLGFPAQVPGDLDYLGLLGAYDFHDYGADFDFRTKGHIATQQRNAARWVDLAHHEGKPVFLSEFGTMAYGWVPDKPGPSSPPSVLAGSELVVRLANAGVDGFNRWSFLNRGDLDGQWQLVDTWDQQAKKLLAEFRPHPDSFFCLGLLSRFTAQHSAILGSHVDGGRLDGWPRVFAAAFRSPAGNLTLALLNDASTEFPLKLTLQATRKPAHLSRYRYGEAQQNRVDIQVQPQTELTLTPQANVLEDTLPANSLTIYSTYKLEHDAPGLIVESPQPVVNYARPVEPVVKPALLPLPPGAVEPAGWLRDWAQAARDGITGHLDEWHPTFADGWKGVPITAPGAKPDGTGWPIEQSAYWLDGALRLGLVLHDEALIRKIRARLDPVVEGVNKAEFGTTFIHWKQGYKPQGFDSWAHSQMGRALVALYEGTGDPRVLGALVKVYADYPTNMGTLRLGGAVSGLCNLDAMLETYSFSGDRRILERALRAMARPEVVQDVQAWEAGRLAPGHMVILYENVRLPAVVYPWSGDGHQLRATLGAFRWLDEYHMLPYGVASGEEFASGIGAFRKTETCDVTAMLLAASWMYRIQGRSDWGDRMERAFFNAGAAPVARDFQTMCYYQSPNRLRSDALPCEQPFCPGPEGVRFHRLGCPTVLCCVGALNRIIPNYIIHMWMGTRDNGLAATLYGPCTVSALVGDRVPVELSTTTDYPFSETIRLRVEPTRQVSFPLYLRIPGWCKNPQATVNGSPVSAAPDARGFAVIARRWAQDDLVELQLPMKPRVMRGYETEFPSANQKYFRFEPAEVFQPRCLPYASVLYGPLLFSLPIADLDPNTPVKDAKWQYALDIDAARGDAGISVERRPMPARWNWPLDAPLALKVPAQAFDWRPTDAQALPDKPVTGGTSESIRLVPYGCTKFRISMFPVTSRAWRPDGK